MKSEIVGQTVSLSGFVAHRHVRRFRDLPICLRTSERAGPVVDAIFDYAWEPVQTGQADASLEASRRLDEFLLPGRGDWRVMGWLCDNQVPEAWQSSAGLRQFMIHCLRFD
ncbi:MAG: hypothetical protein QNJ73_01890 [Gammaproteobacteria bacterium]|nr:hypothetical protein [Gammaproteobacteria bacterium]